MKLKIISILAFFLVIQIGAAQESLNEVLKKHHQSDIPYISATELRMQQSKNDVIILDSRELQEYKVSHIESAISVGFDVFSMENIFKFVKNKETPIVIYCTLGIRSEMIAAKLKKAGISVAAFAAVVLLSFLLSEGVETPMKDGEVLSAAGSRWVGAGLRTFYILAVVAIGAMLYSGVKRFFK